MMKKISFLFVGVLAVLTLCADQQKSLESVFTHIYETGFWDVNKEGKGTSGTGSTVESTKLYVVFLQEFLRENNIKTVVDVGCGDWTFSQFINWNGIDYVGYDVVKSLVDENNKKFGNAHCRFVHGNALDIDLPPADLLICKDVLQHLPTLDIKRFLQQCKKFKHCLITSGVYFVSETGSNRNIQAGRFRMLDLTVSPFNVHADKVLTYTFSFVDKKTKKKNKVKKQVLHVQNCSEKE